MNQRHSWPRVGASPNPMIVGGCLLACLVACTGESSKDTQDSGSDRDKPRQNGKRDAGQRSPDERDFVDAAANAEDATSGPDAGRDAGMESTDPALGTGPDLGAHAAECDQLDPDRVYVFVETIREAPGKDIQPRGLVALMPVLQPEVLCYAGANTRAFHNEVEFDWGNISIDGRLFEMLSSHPGSQGNVNTVAKFVPDDFIWSGYEWGFPYPTKNDELVPDPCEGGTLGFQHLTFDSEETLSICSTVPVTMKWADATSYPRDAEWDVISVAADRLALEHEIQGQRAFRLVDKQGTIVPVPVVEGFDWYSGKVAAVRSLPSGFWFVLKEVEDLSDGSERPHASLFHISTTAVMTLVGKYDEQALPEFLGHGTVIDSDGQLYEAFEDKIVRRPLAPAHAVEVFDVSVGRDDPFPSNIVPYRRPYSLDRLVTGVGTLNPGVP